MQTETRSPVLFRIAGFGGGLVVALLVVRIAAPFFDEAAIKLFGGILGAVGFVAGWVCAHLVLPRLFSGSRGADASQPQAGRQSPARFGRILFLLAFYGLVLLFAYLSGYFEQP